MFAMFQWSFGSTPIEVLLERTLLPAIAGLLALDALCGLLFSRWMRKHPRTVLRSIAIAAPVALVLFASFFVWASSQSYGFLGFLGIASLLLVLYLAYETALFSFLPSFGSTVAAEATEPRAERRLRRLAPLPPLLAFILSIPGFLTSRDQVPEAVGIVFFSVLAALLVLMPVFVARGTLRGLRRRDAPSNALRLARCAWLFVAAYPAAAVLLVAANLLPVLWEGSADSMRTASLFLVAAMPPFAVSATAAALLVAGKKKPADRPPVLEAQ